MSILDIGSPCIDRSSTGVAPSTFIDASNPATASGKITNVAIWANVATTITKVAIFYYNGNNKFTARCTSGNLGAVTPGSVQNFAVDLDVQASDYIGIYFTGGKIELGGVGSGIGLWHSAIDETTCNNKTFSPLGNVAISVYGTGLSVTTQSPTSILEITATGRGTIVGVGGANATVRGFKYGLTQTDTWSASDNGTFSAGAYTKALTGLSLGTTYWIRAYATNAYGTEYGDWVEFTTVDPTVTIQDPTLVLPTTVLANGNITEIGTSATVRGFKYGLTQTDTWSASDNGTFSAGAYTKGLTSLIANTSYWIRAYFINTSGTYYSDWVQFQTAAVGIIPTGTRVNICSDYSGYTYKLMRAETDDGNAYTAYFVINTDLAEKRGLTIYKRILDLHLYFKWEASGTAEIYAKRDSEAGWQSLGSVSLTDVTEPTIIVKHLAVDIKAKSYDFKVSFGNACRFVGVVFEFIPGGTR